MDKILKIFLGNEKTKINGLISKEYVVKYGQENKEGTLECLQKIYSHNQFFLIIAIGVGGMLGYYDARLEAAVTPKKQSMDKVKIKNEEDLTSIKNVVNILLVGSDNGAQGSEKGDHGRSDSMMVTTINFKTKELKLTSFLRDMYVEIPVMDVIN